MLPPSLLPKVERFIDSLPKTQGGWGEGYDPNKDPILKPRPASEDGKRKHPKAGCMKGVIIMHDNFFEPDEDWEEYM